MTMLTSKKLCLMLVMMLVVVMMAACGGGTPAEPGTDAGSTPGTTPNTGSAADTVIKVGVSGTPDVDPAVALTNSSVQAVSNLYDALVFPGQDTPVVPRVAESWTISDDGLTYTFKINEGIKFHNGGELKASDVAFSMNRMLAIGEGYTYLFADFVDSAEAISDYEVVFNLKKPYGTFISALVRMFIVSEEEVMANLADGPYGEFKDYGKAYLTTHDAGSGAYVYKELVQQDYFEASKFEDWFLGWEDRPNAPSGFKLWAIPEPATVRTMMNNKELDMTDQWQSTENLNAMSQMPGVSIANVSTYLVQNMYMNTQKAPLDDVNFRRAMCYMFDYDLLSRDIFVDSAKATGPVSAGVAGHVTTANFEYNLDKAREYIAASKYANDYQNYPIEMMAISDVPNLEKVALMFQASAKELGITVEITKAPWVSVVDKLGSVDTTPHMISINAAPAYNEAGASLERYHSKTMGTWEQGEWIDSSALDAMIEDALGTSDEAERLAKYGVIQNYIVDELCSTAYLADLTERFAYQSEYIKWPVVEDAAPGTVGSRLYGFLHVFADFEMLK